MTRLKKTILMGISVVTLAFGAMFVWFVSVYAQGLPTEDIVSCPPNDRGGPLRLPFEGTWGISQGYAGSYSHLAGSRIRYALDFNLVGLADANQPVYAPGKGRIVRNILSNNEIVCLDLEDDRLGSVELGHFNPSSVTQIGNEFNRGDVLGTLIGGPTTYSTGPHIHIAYFNSPSCSGISLPFNDLFGEGLSFPDTAGSNDWAGSLIGCGKVPEPAEALPGEPPGVIDTLLEWIGFGSNKTEPPPSTEPDIGNVGSDRNIRFGTVDTEPFSFDGFITLVVVKIEAFGPRSFVQLGYNIIDLVMYGAITFLVLIIVYTGFLFVTSGGSDAKVTRARNSLKSIVFGAAVLVVAFALKAAIMILEAQGIITY